MEVTGITEEVPIEIALMTPDCLLLLSASTPVARWLADTGRDFDGCDSVVTENYPAFLKALDSLRSAANMAFDGEAAAITNGLARFLTAAEQLTPAAVEEVCNLGVDRLSMLRAELTLLSQEPADVGRFMTAVQTKDLNTTSVQSELLNATNTEALRAYYKKQKMFHGIIDKVDSLEFQRFIGDVQECMAAKTFTDELDSSKEAGPGFRKIAYVMTTVQSLFRPLQVGEARHTLAAKCAGIVTGLPAPLALLLKEASEAKLQAPEPSDAEGVPAKKARKR